MTASEIFEHIVKARGLKDVLSFANPKYEDLADPNLLPDMEKATKRIADAINSGEKIAIYGDYDVDGMTATTILTEAITKFGGEVVHFIPSRFVDGYGMGKRGVDELKSKDVKLIITVDTGSLSHEHIDYSASVGIDVIVTDHHTVGDTLPNAVAVINPKREDSKYPCKDLAGVGVAFTLIRALQKELPGIDEGQEKWFLDLVAMGTVCDVVPLVSENRTIVYWGLKVLQKSRRQGIKALAEVSSTDLETVNTETFGFRFGPRLNASGRLDTAKLSMNLLAETNSQQAEEFAHQLEDQNIERRKMQSDISKSAIEQAEGNKDKVIVVSGEGWSHGVVGIVASRLVEEFQKPAFVIGVNDGVGVGSARAFGEFHLAKGIKECADVIEKGGGHAAAAGITVKAEKIDEFRKRINKAFEKIDLEVERQNLVPTPDLELENFDGVSEELVELLQQLEPYGVGNPKPVFKIRAKVAQFRGVGAEGVHAKVNVEDSAGRNIDSIGFNLSKKVPKVGSDVDILFGVEINEWNGRKNVQLKLIDIG